MSKAPRKIGSIIQQLMSRRGYGEVQSASALEGSVTAVVGAQVAASIRVGNLKRGVVWIYAQDSPTLQELTFQKRAILRRLQQDHAASNITDLRFRVGQ